MLSKPKSPPSLGSISLIFGFDTEQISDRVLVLGAIQPMHGGHACVRPLAGGGIQGVLERGDELRACFGVRLRLLARRHHAHIELVEGLLPDGGFSRDPVGTSALEGQSGREFPIVVTVDAISIEHRPMLFEPGLRLLLLGHPEIARQCLPRPGRRHRCKRLASSSIASAETGLRRHLAIHELTQ
jgi:hypothetical protein